MGLFSMSIETGMGPARTGLGLCVFSTRTEEATGSNGKFDLCLFLSKLEKETKKLYFLCLCTEHHRSAAVTH